MTPRAHQSQAEYNAGYRSGLAGEPRPARNKGSAHYGGWLAGSAERAEQLKGEAAK